MDKIRVGTIKREFDVILRRDENSHVEFWYARELMLLLGYERWENFEKAVTRSRDSSETSGIEIADHFREVTKMVRIGSGSNRSIKDYMLTRYACH